MGIKLPGSEAVDIAVDEAVMRLSECKEVDALGLTGSLSFGLVDEGSDIDMICIVNKYLTVSERRAILGKQDYSPLTDTIYQEAFFVDGIRIDIQFRERKWFEDVLAGKEMASDFNEKYVLYMLQNAKPLWDGKGTLKQLAERAKYTDAFAKRKVEAAFAYFKEAKRELETLMARGDVTFMHRYFLDLMEKYVSVVFALNGQYFSDVKWGLQKIERMEKKPSNAIKDLKEFCSVGNGIDGIEFKLKLLKRMLQEMADTVKKELPIADIGKAVEEIRGW